MTPAASLLTAVLTLLLLTTPAAATPFLFSTGNPDGKMATASRPESTGKFEIESADDFVLTTQTSVTSATFTGLLTGGATPANVGEVRVEIYRVFPADSDVGRTSGPPTFSTPQVPTRVNSPSDVEVDDRDTSLANLTFTTKVLNTSFTAANSVLPGGIHPTPDQTTGGNGAVTGQEVEFDVTFTTPFLLLPDHYFFVPQAEITTATGEFLWLSAPRPIVSPGTPFPAGFTDLQSWTRDQFLDPDWLRVGGDIVGPTPATSPTFDATFSLVGTTPEPATWQLLGLGMISLVGWRRRHRPGR
jgi:PEP-CTERM motif-containing protein